jgi:hypothetical protein
MFSNARFAVRLGTVQTIAKCNLKAKFRGRGDADRGANKKRESPEPTKNKEWSLTDINVPD